jgi:hypothetical protein
MSRIDEIATKKISERKQLHCPTVGFCIITVNNSHKHNSINLWTAVYAPVETVKPVRRTLVNLYSACI